ncbi:phosphotransferase family protein [Dietzia maris]
MESFTVGPDRIDVARLIAWLDRHGIGEGCVSEIVPVSGGTQNLMYSFSRGDRSFVLRRGPANPRPQSDVVIRREMRLLSALTGTAVRRPEFIHGSADGDGVCPSPFYVMDLVPGYNAAEEIPDDARADAPYRHAMGLSLVTSLAELARVDYREVGLADFGKPEGFLERQVPRWSSELDKYESLRGYSSSGRADFDEIGGWLARHTPRSNPVGIIHGDYHLANVMFSTDAPEVVAIVDWEMATVGDPLMDLGWLLAMWPLSGDEPDLLGSTLSKYGGLPTTDEVVDAYVTSSGIAVDDIGWYSTMGCFKAGIVLEGTYARACAGKADPVVGERLHGMSLALRERALERIS